MNTIIIRTAAALATIIHPNPAPGTIPAGPAYTPTPAPLTVTVTIRPGDTINRIAAANLLPPATILEWNPGITPTRIRTGQTLTIPSPACTATARPGHTPACLTPPMPTYNRDTMTGLTPNQKRIISLMPRSKRRCLTLLVPAVTHATEGHNVDPAAMAAQAITETGSCRHVKGNAYWGVKGTGPNGGTTRFTTHENTRNGRVRIVDNFRAYPTIDDAAADYVRLIETLPHFADATTTSTPHAYLRALQNGTAKYATAPNYVTANMNVIHDYQLNLIFSEENE